MTGEENSLVDRTGDMLGEGALSPLGSLGLNARNGDSGGAI